MTVEIVGMKRETTFTVELPERAVRALNVIGQFGEGALAKAVEKVLSPSEAKTHAAGLADLQRIGALAGDTLRLLNDARAVVSGSKVAIDRAAAR